MCERVSPIGGSAGRWARSGFWLALLIGVGLLYTSPVTAAAAASVNVRCDWSGQSYTDFYAPPPPAEWETLPPGTLVRIELVGSYTPAEVADAAGLVASDYGAQVYRVLYISQAPLGVPQIVSGLVAAPVGTIPANGFPILVDGHATTGTADSCAPSTSSLGGRRLMPWIAAGYMVGATDYTGLGTPGPHPYIVGEAAAFSMLDSARATAQFCDRARAVWRPASNRIILEGHSQGGHAALFAHGLWPTYAPELDLVGTVAFAPAAELRLMAEQMADSTNTLLVDPMTLSVLAYTQYYGLPDRLRTWIQEPFATQLPNRAELQCVGGIALWLGQDPNQVFQPQVLESVRSSRWVDLQPWAGLLDLNTPGNFTSQVPILLIQGGADTLIAPVTTERLHTRLCRRLNPTQLSLYADVGHLAIPTLGRPEALSWMANRLAGLPAPNDCAAPNRAYLPLLSMR